MSFHSLDKTRSSIMQGNFNNESYNKLQLSSSDPYITPA